MPLRLRPGFGYFDELGELLHRRDPFDRAYGRHRRGQTSEFPPLNVWSGEHDTVIAAELPGVAPEDMDIDVDGPVLTIRGARHAPESVANAAAHRRERGYGNFARAITLPYAIDTEKVQAECRDGVLTVYLPRPEAEKPKRIRIASGRGR